MARPTGEVPDDEPGDLYRCVRRNELEQLERYAVAGMLEPAVATPVTGDIHAGLVADRQGRGAPQRARVVVSNVDRFAGLIPDRIVRPGREPIVPAVSSPGAPAALRRHLEAESWIGDDIYPWRRRVVSVAQDRDVLLAVARKAAQSIEELQCRYVELRRRRAVGCGRDCRRRTCRWRGVLETVDLLGETALSAEQHRACCRKQRQPCSTRDDVRAQDEDASARRLAVDAGSRQAGADQRVERCLQILDIRGRAFVEDHEVDCQPLQPPVLERTQQLADDSEIVRVVDPHQYDRQFPRDALRPEQRKSAVAAAKRIGGRPQRRITVEHVTGEALEQHRFVPCDSQVVEFHLPLCPRKRGGALIRRRIAVLVRQVQHLAARRCGQGPERHARRGSGREPHAAAQAEDRIEHGSVGARQRATVRGCDGRADLPAAPDETCAVRLELQFTIHVAFDDGEMCGPGLGLLGRAASPASRG